MVDDEEEERLFQQLKKITEELKFNFSANTVLVMMERISSDGEFTELKCVSGSTLAAIGLARNYAIRQDEFTKAAARKDAED